MKRSLLLLGASGKMGTAVCHRLSQEYRIIPKTSADFDAADFDQVSRLVSQTQPDLIVNAVGMLGIDNCEREPERAFRINTLFPKHLATVSRHETILIHFSTSSVFDGSKNDFYTEKDLAAPLNIYGVTKAGGDAMVSAYSPKHYIFRIPLTFGPGRPDQFAERMLARAANGETLRIAADVFESPSYSLDIADEMLRILNEKLPFGVYHIANRGMVSLYDMMIFFTNLAGISSKIVRASHREFTTLGLKNTNTPLTSSRINPMRSWERAATEFMAQWKTSSEPA